MSPALRAVQLSQSGTGQVLIFPHYTVRNVGTRNYNTLLAITNTTGDSKVVKVRFLEGKNGSEVMDFNLFLDAYDIWTGAVIPTESGARIATNDNSCVAPSNLFSQAGTGDFRNTAYVGDGLATSLDRTREGYVEIIEMGVITAPAVLGYVKHNGPGIPANCAALDALDPGPGAVSTAFSGFLSPPGGGLTGRASIINSENGANFTYQATALEAWSNVVQYTGVGSAMPKLGSASPAVSTTLLPSGDAHRAVWSNGRDAVSAVLMRTSMINEFILDSGTFSSTDWVITFPTKREYRVDGGITAPFSRRSELPPSTGNCDEASNDHISAFNRSTTTYTPPGAVIVPPNFQSPGDAKPSYSCWTSNTIPFQAASLLGSRNTNALDPVLQIFVSAAMTNAGGRTSAAGSTQGANGYLRINMIVPVQKLTALSATVNGQPSALRTFNGLPVISFGVHNFIRQGVVSNYGGVIPTRYTTSITTQ
jgi:hypothetical protein